MTKKKGKKLGAPTWRAEARILDALRAGPLRKCDLMAVTKMAKRTVSKRVNGLFQEGHLVAGRIVPPSRARPDRCAGDTFWALPGYVFPEYDVKRKPIPAAVKHGEKKAGAKPALGRRNVDRDADVLTALRKHGQAPCFLVAETAGYEERETRRSLAWLEQDGLVTKQVIGYFVEWSVAS